MSKFRVALIDKNEEQIPEWVPGELAAADIDFVFGQCKSQADLLALAEDVDILWIYGGNPLANAENLPLLKNCRAVIRSGSGTDRIDADKATELGMLVVNTPHAHHDAVSDHAIALMFAVGRHIVAQDRYQRQDGWLPWGRHEFMPFWRMRQKTLGLVGFGLIPRFIAKKLSGFELDVLTYDPYVDESVLAEYGARRVELNELLQQSDIVSIHTPLTAATHHLIGEEQLRMMKTDAILVNTARGPVIDEAALVKALDEKWIRGAGLDVFEKEPTDQGNPLLIYDNVVVTPHTAGASDESIELTWRLSVEACKDIKAGFYPRSYVNRSVEPKVALQHKERGEYPN